MKKGSSGPIHCINHIVKWGFRIMIQTVLGIVGVGKVRFGSGQTATCSLPATRSKCGRVLTTKSSYTVHKLAKSHF